jgi:hypothetical protein
MFALVLLVVTRWAVPAAAQVTGRTEIGVAVSFLELDEINASSRALGGRVTFDATPWLGIEGELNFYPSEEFRIGNAVPFVPTYELEYRRSRLEALAGVRVGFRVGRLGVFGKARPGFAHLADDGLECTGPGCAVILTAPPAYRTEFVFDVGGIAEFYAAPGATVRVDVGDTIIRHRSAAPPCASCTTHNLTTRIGIGVRF